MEISIAVEAMKLAGINCEYKNDSLIEINSITVYIVGNLAQFGTYKFRYSDIYDFCCCLDQSGLLCLSLDKKHSIRKCYEKLDSLASAPKVKL